MSDATVDFSAYEAIKARHTRPNGHDAGSSIEIRATPFAWVDPVLIPRRQFLYGRHLARGFVSTKIAGGGSGKSKLITVEALAMVSNHALLGDEPAGQLRVWHINLEDPEDELRRRFAAAAIHYNLGAADIEGRLFLDSGRNTEIILATEGGSAGIEIAVPVVEAMKAEIAAKQIDVVQIDPFVACHSVAENDNTKVAAVVRLWASIAEATACAVELVHHARKPGTGQQTITADDARGATALINGVRSAQVLNTMSRDEAARAGIDEPQAYFSVTFGKANLAPRSDKATWRRIVGVPLGNGDLVGVVEAWNWPDPFVEVSIEDAKEVQKRIAEGEWRVDYRSAQWAGKAVAEALGFDLSRPDIRASVAAMLKTWLQTGALREVTRLDDHRKSRRFIEVGRPFA